MDTFRNFLTHAYTEPHDGRMCKSVLERHLSVFFVDVVISVATDATKHVLMNVCVLPDTAFRTSLYSTVADECNVSL